MKIAVVDAYPAALEKIYSVLNTIDGAKYLTPMVTHLELHLHTSTLRSLVEMHLGGW